eukprot:1191430-Prorocentrum_minimum.AAC.6
MGAHSSNQDPMGLMYMIQGVTAADGAGAAAGPNCRPQLSAGATLTVELTTRTLLSHLITRKFNSPTNSLQTPYIYIYIYISVPSSTLRQSTPLAEQMFRNESMPTGRPPSHLPRAQSLMTPEVMQALEAEQMAAVADSQMADWSPEARAFFKAVSIENQPSHST